MKILGIEWSSSKRTLAIGHWSSESGVDLLATGILPGGRDSKYFEAFQEAVFPIGVQKSEIKAIVVGLGPGSYAGIRSAISVAYGWHLANQAALIGIPSSQVLARKAFDSMPATRIHTLVDAQRGECYHSTFEKKIDGSIHVTKPLTILNPKQLPAIEYGKEFFVGSDIDRWFQSGDARKDALLEMSPDAATLLQEAESSLQQSGSNVLEPVYLRPTSFVKAPAPRFPLSGDVNSIAAH